MTSSSNELTESEDNRFNSDFVTMIVNDQLFGVPVLQVQDVLRPQRITPVPLAPKEIVGSLNLRGRIVTAMDMRVRLGMEARPTTNSMSVVVQHNSELYSLIVDQVGEVMSLPRSDFENNPTTLPLHWREVSQGIYRLKARLLIALDISRLLRIEKQISLN